MKKAAFSELSEDHRSIAKVRLRHLLFEIYAFQEEEKLAHAFSEFLNNFNNVSSCFVIRNGRTVVDWEVQGKISIGEILDRVQAVKIEEEDYSHYLEELNQCAENYLVYNYSEKNPKTKIDQKKIILEAYKGLEYYVIEMHREKYPDSLIENYCNSAKVKFSCDDANNVTLHFCAKN